MSERDAYIHLMHGSGGKVTHQLIAELFYKAFDNHWLAQKNDYTEYEVPEGRLVVATDAHVVSPLFFPGGNIGSLSVHGTINDVVMSGAKPLYLTASFILEEGLSIHDLQRIVYSMAEAAREAEVAIIAGDTKVVEKGKGDGIFISTTGIGVIPQGVHISGDRAKPGDLVLLNGFIGDHAIAIMSARPGMQFVTRIQSDTASLHDLVAHMVRAVPDLHGLRDPTRGGVGTILNEWAEQSRVGFMIEESSIPVREEVQGVCELLGLDPLYLANEGKLLAICPEEHAELLLNIMKQHDLGKHSAIIGKVVEGNIVKMKTTLGGVRIIDWLPGDPLPRIC